MADVISRSIALATAFRTHDLPVVLVNVAGTPPGRTEHSRHAHLERKPDWMDFVAGLQGEKDYVVTKRSWGAFTGTDLKRHLNEHGVTQVVIVGCATSIGVDSTAREAYSSGFNVTIAVDAVTDLDVKAHENSLTWVFPRLGETATTAELLEHLSSRRA
jgi:nicotinamidase-related amidase